MTPFEILKFMESKAQDGKFAVTTADSKNDYYTDQLPTIPVGTKVLLNHGGDFGLYAIADVDGVLHNVKFLLIEVHNIDWDNLTDN